VNLIGLFEPELFVIIALVMPHGHRLGPRRWPDGVAGERGDRGSEVATVEVLHELNDVTADGAAAAVPHLLFDVHAESIGAAAHRARPDQLGAGPLELDAAPGNLMLEENGASERDVDRALNLRPSGRR
jgi:hypothetical protein